MDGGKQLAIHHSDCFEPVFFVALTNRFGDRMDGIIEYPLSKIQRQTMLRSIGRIFGCVKFKVHTSVYVNHIAITIADRPQHMTVSAMRSLYPSGEKGFSPKTRFPTPPGS